MGHSLDILKLREELKAQGVLPADEPEVKPDHAMKQAMKNPVVRAAVLVSALAGGGWAFDIPDALANILVRKNQEQREKTPGVGAVLKALQESGEYVLLKARVDTLEKKLDTMDARLGGKLDLLIEAENQRKGREQAQTEAAARR